MPLVEGPHNSIQATHKKTPGLSLWVNQQVTSDPHTIFCYLGKALQKFKYHQWEMSPTLSSMKERVELLITASLKNEDNLLDAPFSAEEVDIILRKLKSGRR